MLGRSGPRTGEAPRPPQVVHGGVPTGQGTFSDSWKLVYLAREFARGDKIDLMDADLGDYRGAQLTTFTNFRIAIPTRRVCSTTDGYWGDYDGTSAIPTNIGGGFFTAFPKNVDDVTSSDPGDTCNSTDLFSTSPPIHVFGVRL